MTYFTLTWRCSLDARASAALQCAHMNKTTNTDRSVPPLTLGWRLRMALESSDLSQEDMAELVESHRTTLTRWMHDEIIPKRLYLRIWADATDVPFEWFEEVLPPLDTAAASPIKAEKPAQPTHKSRRRRGTSTRWDTDCVEDASCDNENWVRIQDALLRYGGYAWARRFALDAVPVP